MTSPYTPNTGPQGGGYGAQVPPAGPVPPAPGAPGQPRMAPGPAPLPPPASHTPLIVGVVVGSLVVVLVVVGLLWLTRWRTPTTPGPAYNPGPVSSPGPAYNPGPASTPGPTSSPGPASANRAPASGVIETQVVEECHSAVKQTVRNPVFTRDSATYERTDSNGDQHWTVSGRVTGTNTSGKTGTFEWSCTATHIDKNGLVDAWSSVETTPVR